MKALTNAKIVTPLGVLEDYVVYLSKETIEAILPYEERHLTGKEIIDLKGRYLLPGFIDIHIHGSSGMDVMDASEEALQHISQSLIKTGVTSYLGTTMTQSRDSIFAALECIRTYMKQSKTGARLIGAHLEGPFIQAKAKGAHIEKFITAPDQTWITAFDDVIKIVTLAPEVEGAADMTTCCCQRGVVVSLGHTQCTFSEAMSMIELGANSVTHLFNAMSGLHHREPGLVGAALTSDIYTELIADTIHCRPELYPLLIKAKGPDRLILITDAMKGQCMAPGTYDLGGQPVIVNDDSARLEDGTLAGSILTQNRSLYNMITYGKVSLVEVSKMLSTNAANLLKRYDLGRIEKGCRADFVVVDEALQVVEVWQDGKRAVGGSI